MEIALDHCGNSVRGEDKQRFRLGIKMSFKNSRKPVVQLSMDEPGPVENRIRIQPQFLLQPAAQFAKEYVNRDDVRVRTVDARRIHERWGQVPKGFVSPSHEMICREEPKVGEEFRSRESWDSVPVNSLDVYDR